MQAVQVSAARGNRSLTGGQPDGAATLRQRRIVLADKTLLFYRRAIDTAVAIAKKTRYGLPTGAAITERWWISDNRPPRSDRTQLGTIRFRSSFEGCCDVLGLDVDVERKRLLAEIDDSNVQALVRHAGEVVYQRRAAVLTCAGIPTTVGRQYVIGLVDPDDYEDVADPRAAKAFAMARKRESKAAAQDGRRAKTLKAG